MSTDIRPSHSPLGASGAERWMNCAGSVALIQRLRELGHLDEMESDEPEYRSQGTTAHTAAYTALTTELEPWELIGQKYGVHEVSVEMSNAIAVYVAECQRIVTEHPGGVVYNEFGIDYPEFHKSFYGTLDRGYVVKNLLFIRDFKYGAGIAIDVEWNPQIMYYAFGLLRHHPEVDEVDLGIVQPRGFHPDGMIRTWRVSADVIRAWAEEKLRPAMDRTALEIDLLPGPHCRFCPAKLVCPVMESLFGAAMQADPKKIINFSMATLARSYDMIAPVKAYLKALETEMLRRLLKGDTTEFAKLVNKKADRVFKDGAEVVFVEKYGDEAKTEPKLKTPAQMEGLGNEAKSLVKSWAYTPQTGYTVARMDDRRTAVKISTAQELFGENDVDAQE